MIAARQGRGQQALSTIEPLLRTFRARFEGGAKTLPDRDRLATALLIKAIAQADDAAGRVAREAALQEAAQVLDALTDEAKQLYQVRVLMKWIAEERAKLPST